MLWSILTILFLIHLHPVHPEKLNNNIQNDEVITLIDITSNIVKGFYKIIIKNVGVNPVESYKIELREEALVNFMNNANQKLPHETIQKSTTNCTTYMIKLDKALLLNEKYKLLINLTFLSELVPAAKHSRYNEEHSFLFKANRLFYSEYFTVKHRCILLTNPSFNRNIEVSAAYDSIGTNMLNFREEYIKPHSYDELIIMFTTPIPILKVKTLNRNIFISNFGKIMVQDQVVVENTGPKLQGPYFNNQSDYWMYTHLPSSAEDIALSDVIGTNLKTYLYENNGTKTLKFIPRYSLRQGGWKSTYTLRYNIPVYEYIFKDQTHYYIKIRAMDHILNDVLVEDADVNIILPDGASVVDVFVPLGFQRGSTTNIYTSLSVSGRPMVNLRGRHLIEEHIADVVVKYNFSLFSFLSAPFYIVFLLESILFLIILLRKYS
ncbi:hypothetical protein WA026_008610 [Henosepilachna vigintioctopunctata]|uniref:Dolichyl-diphosphooligosaccharide--protein glycosyltransferase subunit 1 n=1 Tax=Henosepilachna vigintioctopunctata TaxID=420089 RepID=A0AAW1UGB3_9CUCU